MIYLSSMIENDYILKLNTNLLINSFLFNLYISWISFDFNKRPLQFFFRIC